MAAKSGTLPPSKSHLHIFLAEMRSKKDIRVSPMN
jgi:hypothetical protein